MVSVIAELPDYLVQTALSNEVSWLLIPPSDSLGNVTFKAGGREYLVILLVLNPKSQILVVGLAGRIAIAHNPHRC